MKQVPPGNFPMHHGRVEANLEKSTKPKSASRRHSAVAAKLQGKDGAHLIAIFCPERVRIKMEE
jgi:hypothetical protein